MSAPISPVPAGVRVRVPAKINLALKVGPSRPDGYHPLATVYQAVSLYDEVHAAWADPDEFEVVVTGEGADLVPLDDSNLAIRAARTARLRSSVGTSVAPSPVTVTLNSPGSPHAACTSSNSDTAW